MSNYDTMFEMLADQISKLSEQVSQLQEDVERVKKELYMYH